MTRTSGVLTVSSPRVAGPGAGVPRPWRCCSGRWADILGAASAVAARGEHARPLDDPETLDEGEERPGEGRGARALLDERPVYLLSQRASGLQHGLEVRLLLGQRQELRHHHVVDRGDENRLRPDLELRRAGEMLVDDLAACR